MKDQRVYNFSAGPAVLPVPVLEEAQRNLVCMPELGASPLEVSHRSSWFVGVVDETIANLRELLAVPDGYHVLFLQGGSRLQFSMVPMNLLRGTGKSADYVLTGSWGMAAVAEARREGPVREAFNGKPFRFARLPKAGELDLDPKAAYVHFTSNETIEGVQFGTAPELGDAPLVCDASSDFLSRPLAIEKYGLVYACAQKNAGPAGVTVVILRDDLLARSSDDLPSMLNYRTHVKANSLYNTPPVFAVYVVMLVTRWLRDEMGGLAAMEKINREKSQLLYDAIDDSAGFYRGHAEPYCRSTMNVTFRLPSDELQAAFIKEGESRGLTALKGHRSVGGIRASVYNAMPREGVVALRDFMNQFRTGRV